MYGFVKLKNVFSWHNVQRVGQRQASLPDVEGGISAAREGVATPGSLSISMPVGLV
jgi:hypothetical protein